MIAMQYKIVLPSDFDMDIIKQRIKNNGVKIDGFNGLLYKFYLVCEKKKRILFKSNIFKNNRDNKTN